MRTTQTPPARASTIHSLAPGGDPCIPSTCATHFFSGSQAVTGEVISMPGPKFIFTATGFPPCSSNSAGTIQDEMPGPVAMARQTSSGVPGTSISTWMDRRPEASFFTLMTAPWMRNFWWRVSSLRLGVEKVVHHRDDDGHTLHQRDVGGVGQD